MRNTGGYQNEVDTSDWQPPTTPPTERAQLVALLRAVQPTPDPELVEERFGSVELERQQAFLAAVPGVEVRDFIEDPSRLRSDDLDLLKDLNARPAWSAAFAAFVLHGYFLTESDAPAALAAIKRAPAPPSEGVRVLASYARLRDELDPAMEASPPAILHLASTWPVDARPAAFFFAWSTIDFVLRENDRLKREILKRDRYVALRERETERATKKSLTDRAEAYVALLASLKFPEKAGKPNGLAARLHPFVLESFHHKSPLRLGPKALAMMLDRGLALMQAHKGLKDDQAE